MIPSLLEVRVVSGLIVGVVKVHNVGASIETRGREVASICAYLKNMNNKNEVRRALSL